MVIRLAPIALAQARRMAGWTRDESAPEGVRL
jgi:hypothetical protein